MARKDTLIYSLIICIFLLFTICCEKADENTIDDGINGVECVDADGNVYKTVLIGDQQWMAENLRVTQYNNGDAIPTGLDDSEWSETTDGAFAIYPHNEIYGLNSADEVSEAYGKLYNWYAVDDSRGLCPAGWRVPTENDWKELVDYVVAQGFPDVENSINGAGNALKSCRQVDHPNGGDCATSEHPRWSSSNTHSGFDEFGFSTLPGGSRYSNGTYLYIGGSGHWWTSSEFLYSTAWCRSIHYNVGDVTHSYGIIKKLGFSVRCTRDN